MVDNRVADPETLERLAKEARDEVAEGVEFALAAPFPPESEVTDHVYA